MFLLAQSVIGNIPGMQAHLNGVATLMDMRDQFHGSLEDVSSPEEEMTERFVLL